ncbi:MtnX-like HAD-IB family phosphatase [Sporolactobacillus kofuensis]|uniref:MtnX-like HAD-IB family phosphatase n=1 Tax=Sporolactobacillus kofuensis TaxID=269672 RepID=A0ABW1WC32_9BACL|nr:MtnX-like HAD-IB family phosphatase [Sporolactobacillus kofuensis]MCO7175016.1 MtnX-like HAD-IB family phosphatase [Sporolactobacillus kofuensis]
MTKSFLFLSDFDGTLSDKDFFHVIIDRHFADQRDKLYDDWDKKVMTDLDYLSRLFKSIDRDQVGIDEDIDAVPFDPYAKKVIEHVKALGGAFVVISAGTDYYIKRIFEKQGITDVKIYSNPGVYENRGIQLKPDPNGSYYSELYGIDKQKLARDLMKEYNTVLFAGDSLPDLKAAMLADTIFAKGKLQNLLDQENKEYVAINSFKDVENYLATHEEAIINGQR